MQVQQHDRILVFLLQKLKLFSVSKSDYIVQVEQHFKASSAILVFALHVLHDPIVEHLKFVYKTNEVQGLFEP